MTGLPGVESGVEALRVTDVPVCVEVVQSLPEWFGYPGSSGDVESASREQEGFVIRAGGRAVAFVTFRPNFEESVEITYLAVHAIYRRHGMGSKLVRAVAKLCDQRHVRSICLLTLGPSAENSFYRETVEFYQALGFWRVRELQNAEWGGAYTLVMVAPTSRLLV